MAVLAVAGRNGPGVGMLRTTGDGTLAAWRAPGSSTFGVSVNVSVDGTYLLEDGTDSDKWVRVQVAAAFLAASPMQGRVYLRTRYNNGLAASDVAADDAQSGDVDNYLLQLDNVSRGALRDLRFWLEPGTTNLELSDDFSTWVAPTTEETALVFPILLIAATTYLYVRRTTPAASECDPGVLNRLHARFDGLR
jgi:hypothetical protein